MPTIHTLNGYSYEIPDPVVPAPIVAQALVDGSTHLNLNDNDNKHLVLTGDINHLESYIQCLDTAGNTKFDVDNTGTVIATGFSTDLYSSFNTKFNDHDNALANYAATATINHNTQQAAINRGRWNA